MNAIPSELVSREQDTDVVHETEDGLVEVGAVSETKGSLMGFNHDNGAGFTFA